MFVIDARIGGTGLKFSATTKRSIQVSEELHSDFKSPLAYNSTATENSINIHQHPRKLQTEEELEFDCETALKFLLGPNSDPNLACTCDENGELTSECKQFQSEFSLCDTIQE